MPSLGPEFVERAHALNAVVRLRKADGLPIRDDHAEEFEILRQCVEMELPTFYAAMVNGCGR